jgi:hypothetical protein
MDFEKKRYGKWVGEFFGYLLAYCIFSIVIYYFLELTRTMPEGWGVFHGFGIGFAIMIIGIFLRRLLR